MRNVIILFLLVFPFNQLLSQDIYRVEVEGRIIVNDNEIEGVTVYNSSSNKGTITDERGKFKIEVALNDQIEVSALQFMPFSLTVDEQIISSKQITVYLVERINKLDEVVILSSGLSGILIVDANKVKTFNPDMDAIYFGVGDLSVYEFSSDQYSQVENQFIYTGQLNYGANVLAIIDFLMKPQFRSVRFIPNDEKVTQSELSSKNLEEIYGREFITNNFSIPEDKVEAFVVFVERNGLDPKLYLEENKLQLMEFLYLQSKLFLKS